MCAGWWWESKETGPQPSRCSCPEQLPQDGPGCPQPYHLQPAFLAFKFLLCEKHAFLPDRGASAAEATINGPALPSRPCCACKKAWQPLLRPGVSCTHTLIPRLKLSHQKQLVSQVHFYFEHFQSAYQDVVTQDVTMPLDSSKHPPPTSIKRVADPFNLNWCLKQSLTTTTADQSQW